VSGTDKNRVYTPETKTSLSFCERGMKRDRRRWSCYRPTGDEGKRRGWMSSGGGEGSAATGRWM